MPAKITDPILGDEGEVFGAGERAAGIFTTAFAPTKSRVLVLVDVIDGAVPHVQRELFREVAAWYPEAVHEVYAAILRKVREDPAAKELTSLEEIQDRLQLTAVDIRYPFRPPAKCILEYKFDPNAPKWFVRIDEEFQVEWVGLGD
ncbi:MAG TPA: hypothetical protein VJ123_04760 [Anaerolineales bacterium]|nr:hypothetical protein [Anaerolineales bacterium]